MQIGRFNVDARRRKEGGQAFVYFGVDQDTGQRVAVKVARPSDWSHRRMRREIAIQGKLDHPNILPIIGHDGERRWYAMREAEGSLEDLGPFQRAEWTRFRVGLLGVAECVKYAHERRFVHRDLTPGNVLIFPDRWVVADWGFVYEEPKLGARMTQPLERFGTPDFMAPECLIDPRDVRPAADVFSLVPRPTSSRSGGSLPGELGSNRTTRLRMTMPSFSGGDGSSTARPHTTRACGGPCRMSSRI